MNDKRLDRRAFVGAASAAGVLAAGSLGLRLAAAQDATPSAGEATPASSSGESLVINFAKAEPTELGPAIPPEFTDNEQNWPTEHGNLQGTRAAAGSGIDSSTVDSFDVAWTVPISASSAYGSMTAAPVIVGDTVYMQDMASNIWAIDKNSGEVKWTKEYNVGLLGPNGLAVSYGRVFGALGDTAEAVCVDAETGEEQWRVTLSNNVYEGIDIAPLVYDNIVYISTVPGDSKSFYQGGSKGILYGLDAATGHTLFQWDTTTEDLWGNFRLNSGGGLWHPPVVDDAGYLYFSVANASPYPGTAEFPAGSGRPGDNDYANSLVSLDVEAGKMRWYLNVKPHDLFDLDLHLSPILATVDIEGTSTPIVLTSGKLGYVVAARQDTGEELWRTPVGKHQNDDLQELPADDFVEVYPGTTGGVETPIAYADGVVFAPVYNNPTWFSATDSEGRNTLQDATGNLVAIDAATGEILWDAEQPAGMLASAAVANDVVFTGGLDGVVRGYNVADGTQVFSWQASAGLNAPFSISGDYLFIPAGGPLIASADTTEPETPQQALIALKIGGGSSATPAS